MRQRFTTREQRDYMTENHAPRHWGSESILPVSVMTGHLDNERGVRGWRVMGVVVGDRFASDDVRSLRMRSGPEGDLYLWMGFSLRLRIPKATDYSLNIMAERPSAYVIARHEDDGLRPLHVTVSLDEAQNLDATDLRDSSEQVYPVVMPPEVYRWVEEFVLEHYVPHKRKRRGKKRSKALFDAEVGDSAGDEA
ncbi:MAG: DUF3305 domain-containing protein [Aquisalimonadaceae bacterium]